MRLTDKIEMPLGYGYIPKPSGKEYEVAQSECVDKLGQLEDIEEDLGIDLITYFKIKSAEKVFMKEEYPNNEIKNDISEMVVRPSKNSIDVFYKGFINIHECDMSLSFKDYGKTWALTKEELL